METANVIFKLLAMLSFVALVATAIMGIWSTSDTDFLAKLWLTEAVGLVASGIGAIVTRD